MLRAATVLMILGLALPVASAQEPLSILVEQTLLNRGDSMLDHGDVASARLLYQRAAEAGVGIAAFKLANTYDPAFLAEHNLRGIKPDPEQAAMWYRRAEQLGEPQAAKRLKNLAGG